MKRKMIAMFTAVAITGSLLVGCGATAQETKEETAASAEEETEEATSEAEEAASEAAEEAASEAAEEAASEAAEEPTSESTEEATSEATEETVGMQNPWSEVASAEEAAQVAGIGSLNLVENLDLGLGDEFSRTYRCMDGLAEIVLEYAASQVTVRKGIAPEDGDVSGDYNTHALTWTQNIKGLEVNCAGNREDASMKTTWTLGDMAYSITTLGLGGDTDFGLSADQINSVVNGFQ